MLSPSSWHDKAQNLSIGSKVRTDHDCGGRRTLTIRHDESGTHAFCFRCNDTGWLPPLPVPLAVRLERLRKQHEADASICHAVALPEPQVKAWADWPPACRLWFLKAGLCAADLPRLGAYYHPPTNRVFLPVIDPLVGPVFWQARAVDGRQPKYLAPDVSKALVIPVYGSAEDVTLTEDLLSAYKVGKVGEGWSLLGTSPSTKLLSGLVERGCKVNVWLDPDSAGRKAAAKVLKTLRAMGVECRDIISKQDPKLLHRAEIQELLSWHSNQAIK